MEMSIALKTNKICCAADHDLAGGKILFAKNSVENVMPYLHKNLKT